MLRIAICDDQPIFIEPFSKLLLQYSAQNKHTFDIQTFTDGNMLLECTQTFDIIFLDIDMPAIDGMAVAKVLRDKGCESLIVFVTSHQERVFDAFEVSAFRFLIKPAEEVALFTVMDAAITTLAERSSQVLIIELPTTRLVQVPLSEILYLESLGKYTYIHTKQEVFETRLTLKHFEEQLENKGFFRSHKSYLVNVKQVKTHTQQGITMLNGEEIHLSRLKASSFKKVFIAELMRTR